MSSQIKEKKVFILLIIILFTVTAILTYFTPMIADDYSYSFSYADRSRRISSIADIFQSLAVHRECMNGRMTAHFFAHLFLSLPKFVFSLCNGLVITLLILILLKFAIASIPENAETTNNRCFLFAFIAASLWIFTPVFGQTFLWLDGSCNYAWSVCSCMAFLLPYYLLYCSPDKLRGLSVSIEILFGLLAFIAGGYSEAGSFGTLFTALCFILLTLAEKRKPELWLILSFIAACIGFAFLMSAPSEWNGRTGSFDLIEMVKTVKRIITAPKENFLPLFCIYGALFALCICSKGRKTVLLASVVLFLGAWATVVPFVAALYLPWRSFLPMVVMLCAACTILLAEISIKPSVLLPTFVTVILTVFLFNFVEGVGDIGFVYYQFRQREKTILQEKSFGNTEIVLPPFEADTKYSAAYLLADIYDDPTLWPNYDLAQYYGVESITAESSGISAD